jgi:hypothetical protein
MSDIAQVYRTRGLFIRSQAAATPDAVIRVLRQELADSYEQLARNEEWLSGEVPPNARHCMATNTNAARDPHPRCSCCGEVMEISGAHPTLERLEGLTFEYQCPHGHREAMQARRVEAGRRALG